MSPELLEAALDEAIRFGPAARLVLTFPGNEEAMHIHPLTYSKIGRQGYRIEIRVSELDDEEMVDDVVFTEATSIETVELQVKQSGAVWRDESYEDLRGEED
jgi:hypothetical protein